LPVSTANHGATRHGAPRPNAASIWSPFVSDTWRVTGSTRGSPLSSAPAGAILVRPDRVIAWRSMGGVDDPRRELGAALDRVLARAS